MLTECNYYPWEVKIKCNLNNYNVVFKLAIAPLKFDLMKKSELRENLKDFTSLRDTPIELSSGFGTVYGNIMLKKL